jgi:hypothetical protein
MGNENAYPEKEEKGIKMETPQLIRNYRKDSGEWGTVSLDDKEEEGLRQEHRERLKEIMMECLVDSKIAGFNGNIEVALALFEKRADHIFSVMNYKMTEKVFKARGNGHE